jgi:cell division protein FtsB
MNQLGPMASTLSAMLASLTKLHKHIDVIDKRQTDIEVQINKMNSKLDQTKDTGSANTCRSDEQQCGT